jgi:hypothetical protein
VTGYTTENSVVADVNDLTFTKVHYSAEKNQERNLNGIVQKSEFDWEVKQTSANTYDVSRLLFKFNSDLELKTENGKINGTYHRHGPAFDWKINGMYANNGHVKIHVNVPMGLDFNLEGKITEK